MRHADDQLTDAAFAPLLNKIVQHRNQALATFQGKAFLADEPCMQITLHAFGRGQLVQQPVAFGIVETSGHRALLEVLPEPEPFPCS